MNKEILRNLHRTQLSEKYFKHNFPDIYNEICRKFDPDINWRERLYLYLNNLESQPKCPICGNIAKFNSVFKGYFTHCSVQCSGKSENRLKKIHETIKEKNGVEHALQSKICRDKYIDTSIQKYGVSNISKTIEYKDKFRRTMVDKYGGMGSSSEIIKSKVINTRRKNRLIINTIENQVNYDNNGNWIIQCSSPENCDICNNCNQLFSIPNHLYIDRKRVGYPLCTKLYPLNNNLIKNTTLEQFVRNILDEYNIEYQTNVRDIISPKEIDIYVPSKKIAIECNGIYWHSLKESSYHINKFIHCDNQNIQLLTIWEDWIRTKPDIVKSLIKSKLGLISNKIYARKCKIREIPSKDYTKFLNNNHIQGSSPSSIKLGLYYGNELVSLITFSKSRTGIGKKEEGYELVRFCNKTNTNVIGAASKLLSHFIKSYNPSKIISYSSNDISNGNLYQVLGFQKEGTSNAYWYVNQQTFERFHRFNFRKAKLKEMGFDIENKTESQIMNELPYWKIYDSGTIRWVKTISR